MTTGPIETKVAAAAAGGGLSGVITWILVTYVPPFHAGLPPALAAFLPYIISLVASVAAGYMAPHTSRAVLPPPAAVTVTPTL